jgi:hypothetical protein
MGCSWPRLLTEDARKQSVHKAQAKYRANHREFDLTKQYLMELLEQQKFCCAVTGVKLEHLDNSPRSVSIDRIDSAEGYVPVQ